MASILRSSKFVRYFSGFARSIVFNSTKETEGNFVHHSQTLCSNITQGFATAVPKPDQNLERSLKRLDQDVRRTGRISRRDIEEVLDEIRQHRSATSSQSLLVIRCCGNLVPEELPEVRTALVQEIWRTLNNLNVAMDVSHYNALLRVYLENEHAFSPTEFLADLEAKGIEPNRVTYQRLISRYCQQGDIEGATRILEFMREKQLPINEHVFNALIMGHSQAGDLESSVGIIAVMKQAGLEPTSDTYTTLLCSYAKTGDVSQILSTLDTCEKNEIFLLDKDIFDIIYTLATNGHASQVDPLILRLRKSSGYNQDAVNLIFRLTNKGEVDVAYKILKTMPRGSRPDGELTDTGSFFIKQLIKAKIPVDKIMTICKELQSDGLNNKAILTAVEAGVISGSVDVAIPFMKELKKMGQPIRQHFFWPLICTQAKEGDSEKILDIVRQMQSEFELLANGETIRDYVVPNLSEKNSERIITLLRTAGVSVSTATTSVVYHLLVQNNLREAAQIATSYNVYYQPGLYRRPLINALQKTNDIDNYIRFLRQVYDRIPRLDMMRRQADDEQQQHDEEIVVVDGDTVDATDANITANQSEILGQMLFDVLVHFRQNRVDIFTSILDGVVKQGLSISNVQAERIQDRLGSELSPEISQLLGQLTAGDLEPIPLDKAGNRPSGFAQLSVDQLERMIEQQTTKGENAKGLKRFLLSACFKSKDLPKTEEVMARLESEGYVLTTGVYAQLIDLYTQLDKPENALQTFERIRTKEPDFILDDYKTVRVASTLATAGKIDEAIKFLEANKKPEKSTEPRSFNYTATCWRILNSLAETGNVTNLQRIFEALEQNNLIEINNALLGPLVKIHLVNNDLQKAVDTFEELCNKHNCTPWKNDLACKLIQAEDATNLQRLTDLSTNIHGEVNSLYDLVFSFVECGRIRQARKILETPGLRSRPQKINVACERYQQEGKVEPLEGLVEATRDLNHIDRGDIYYNLLLSYTKDDQPEKALGLWTKMQEENIPPSEPFLIKLGTFLQSKNLEVPFVIPKLVDVEKKPASAKVLPNVAATAAVVTAATKKPGSMKSKTIEKKQQESNDSPALADFKKAIRSGNDVDAALEAKRKLQSTDIVSLTTKSTFIELLLNSDRLNEANKVVLEMLTNKTFPTPRIFRFYLNKISNAGDVATINQIDSYLNADTKKMVSFDNRVCHAYLKAGKIEQYLGKLEKDMDKAKTAEEKALVGEKFPRGGALGILETHPELYDRFEKVAEKYASNGVVGPMNVLWMHHFITDNTEAHEKIWNNHLKNAPRLMFQRVIHVAREQQNTQLISNLIKQLQTIKVTDGALGIAYSCLLDVHAAKEQYEQGLQTIDEALKFVCLENINRTALQRIKDGIEKSGKSFPHIVPDKVATNKNGPATSSSSSSSSSSTSSSSSSSDDEPATKKV